MKSHIKKKRKNPNQLLIKKNQTKTKTEKKKQNAEENNFSAIRSYFKKKWSKKSNTNKTKFNHLQNKQLIKW